MRTLVVEDGHPKNAGDCDAAPLKKPPRNTVLEYPIRPILV